MNSHEKIYQRIERGNLVRPIFKNEGVFLFPYDPKTNVRMGDVVSDMGPLWSRTSLGLVLNIQEANNGNWIQIMVPGGVGWIGSWNVSIVT